MSNARIHYIMYLLAEIYEKLNKFEAEIRGNVERS